MITRKELADILIKYADPDSCGPVSLGFIPSLVFTRWAWDNQRTFSNRISDARWTGNTPWISKFPDFKRKYITEDLFKDPLTSANIMQNAIKLTGMCRPLREEDDVECIFADKVNKFRTTHSYFGKWHEAREEIASLDLSSQNIQTEDVAAALDDYLASFCHTFVMRGEPHDILANHVVGKLVKSITIDENSIFDPFCRFGYLLQAAGPGLYKIAAAESKFYTAITFIRFILRGMGVKLAPTSSITNPLTTEDGKMVTYPFVVTNISGITNDTETAAYQLDPHHRFQSLLPKNNSLNTTSAAVNAWGFTKDNGHCFIICSMEGENVSYNPTGIFSTMLSQRTLRTFLMEDYIEAVIKVPPNLTHDPGDAYAIYARMSHTDRTSCMSEIYVLARGKSQDRKNKIQFIDASSCKSDSEVIDKVTDAYIHMKEIPGFSVMVPLSDVMDSKPPILRPEWFTCTIELPKSEDIGKLNRELERLENQRGSLTVDLRNVVKLLSEEEV